MKTFKICALTLLSILMAFCICSCGGDDDPTTPTPTPVADKIEFPATVNTKPVFNAEGGTATVTFTASKAWTATAVNTRADDWLTISPTSGSAGVATLTIKTTANDTPDDRAATITIKSGTASQNINVTQKQKDALTISSDKYEVDAEGGEISVEVKANIEFAIKTDVDWITQADTRAMKTTSLSFNVAENDDSEKREGHVTISNGTLSETVTVYQAANVPTIVLTKNDFAISAEGGDITVEVRSNVDVSLKMPEAKWIKESSTRSVSTHTYVFTIDKNEGYDNRTAEIIFFNKANNLSEKVTVTQMQLNAIIVALNEYTISAKGGALDFDVQTNVDFSVSIEADWVTQADTRALRTETLHFDIATNEGMEDRTGIINITDGKIAQSITIIQKGYNEELEKERQALMDLFNATDGPHWKNNENWGSDKPVGEWYGVGTDSEGYVISLALYDNALNNKIPEAIGKLVKLKELNLSFNNLSGIIPEAIGNLSNLLHLNLGSNQLTGSIPEIIGNLKNLRGIELEFNQLTGSIPESIELLSDLGTLWLFNNQLTGSIPESIGNLDKLTDLQLSSNKLTGPIPETIGNLLSLKRLILYDNQLSGTIPNSIGNLVNLVYINLSNNHLSGSIPESIGNLSYLEQLDLSDNQLSGSIPKTIGNLTNLSGTLLLNRNQLSGLIPETIGNLVKLTGLLLGYNQLSGTIPDSFTKLKNLESLWIQDNKMDGVLSETLLKSDWWQKIKNSIVIKQQQGYRLKYGWLYESTDFSKDGEVKKIQSHTKGKGIVIVITADAFSDRLIADGTFDDAVNWAIEAFFAEEPYTTFRDFFDIYSVTAVSKNEMIDEDIIFETKNGDDGTYSINSTKIADYVRKVPELFGDLKNITAIVLLNNEGAESRAWMSGWSDGYNFGLSEVGSAGILQHEIGGHCIGRLADEYTSDDPTGNTAWTDFEGLKRAHECGEDLNVDVNNDPSKVLWKDFIQNHDYDVEKIGIYEGACHAFSKGIYRSTENSIMRYNSGGFNAPSRWAIYQHIMELAGESCSFQDFLAYDKKNLERIAKNANTRSYVEKSAANIDVSKLGAPPVFYDYPSSEIGMH